MNFEQTACRPPDRTRRNSPVKVRGGAPRPARDHPERRPSAFDTSRTPRRGEVSPDVREARRENCVAWLVRQTGSARAHAVVSGRGDVSKALPPSPFSPPPAERRRDGSVLQQKTRA